MIQNLKYLIFIMNQSKKSIRHTRSRKRDAKLGFSFVSKTYEMLFFV